MKIIIKDLKQYPFITLVNLVIKTNGASENPEAPFVFI